MQSRKKLVKKLIKHMTRVQRHLRSGQASAWSGLDFTMPQVKTLFLLAESPMRMRGIAKRLGVEMPSATTMIDRLAAKGLVDASKTRRTAGPWCVPSPLPAGTRWRSSGPCERRGSSPSPTL